MMVDKDSMELLNKFIDINEKIYKEKEETTLVLKKMTAHEILCEICLSRKLFKKNNDLGIFLKNYFNIEFSKWTLSSRTLICGKIIRFVNQIKTEEEINTLFNQLFRVLLKIEQEKSLDETDIYEVIEKMEI